VCERLGSEVVGRGGSITVAPFAEPRNNDLGKMSGELKSSGPNDDESGDEGESRFMDRHHGQLYGLCSSTSRQKPPQIT
jgi:hypothetical protein